MHAAVLLSEGFLLVSRRIGVLKGNRCLHVSPSRVMPGPDLPIAPLVDSLGGERTWSPRVTILSLVVYTTLIWGCTS